MTLTTYRPTLHSGMQLQFTTARQRKGKVLKFRPWLRPQRSRTTTNWQLKVRMPSNL